jgi:hypothetical protein
MASKAESSNGGAQSFYEDEANLKKLCNFLRSNEGPPVREAVQMDQRVYYLKGALLLCAYGIVVDPSLRNAMAQ